MKYIWYVYIYIYVYIWNQFVEQSRRGKETKIANCRKKNIGERWKCFSMTDSNYDVLKSRHTANFFFFLSIHIFYAFEFEPFRSLSLCHGASAYMYKKNCCLFDRNWIFRMHHNNRMIHIFFFEAEWPNGRIICHAIDLIIWLFYLFLMSVRQLCCLSNILVLRKYFHFQFFTFDIFLRSVVGCRVESIFILNTLSPLSPSKNILTLSDSIFLLITIIWKLTI